MFISFNNKDIINTDYFSTINFNDIDYKVTFYIESIDGVTDMTLELYNNDNFKRFKSELNELLQVREMRSFT